MDLFFLRGFPPHLINKEEKPAMPKKKNKIFSFSFSKRIIAAFPMEKVAFLTLDVEDLKDSLCFQKKEEKEALPSAMDGVNAFFALCKENDVKATLFVLASRLEEDLPLLQEAISLGFEIGIHGYEHVMATRYSLEEFKFLTKKAKDEVERKLGISVRGYRAPGWAIREEEHASLSSLGFEYSSSLCFTKSWASFSLPPKLAGYQKLAPYIYRNKSFTEFALPTVSSGPFSGLPLGGGVVPRLFPLFEVSAYMEEHAKKGDPFVLNAHPFEFSSYAWKHHPELRIRDNIYLNDGRKNWKKRLARYIEIFKERCYSFMTFEEYLKNDFALERNFEEKER